MPLTKRLLLLLLVLALVSTAVLLLMPVIVADGIRLFAVWKGNQQGIKIQLGPIESPLLGPVVIHRVQIHSAPPCAFQADVTIPRMELELNLRALFSRASGRVLRALSIENAQAEVRRLLPNDNSSCHFDWRFLHQLLADRMRLSNIDLHIDNGATRVDLHGLSLSASEIESGQFYAREIRVTGPFFKQRFLNLRGATQWENDRLTVGALSLARGLDIETIAADFAHLPEERISFDINLQAFGGNLRANVASEDRDRNILWNIAGTAANISLGQMSSALGFTVPVRGSVHASKFTFRGDTEHLARDTASVWMEVTDFTWRDRTADTVMIGASLYNRQVEIEQLYVKQHDNQLTLTGQYALPFKTSDWVNPEFRADISATINDLGEFAHLFGAAPDRFSGALQIAGTLNGRKKNFGGAITIDGKSLQIFDSAVDHLHANLRMQETHLLVDAFEARRDADFLTAKGEIDLAHQHRYSGEARSSVAQTSGYSGVLPTWWKSLGLDGSLQAEWKGHGDANSQFGDFTVTGRELHWAPGAGLLPFKAKIAGNYTPQIISLRECTLEQEHATLTASATVASDYVQLQTLRFDLNGQPKLQGRLFVPVSLGKWRSTGSFMTGLAEKGRFDISLTLEPIDLAELDFALRGKKKWSGRADGRLQSFGPLQTLNSNLQLHLRDLANDEPARLSADIEAHTVANALTANITAVPSSGSHFNVTATLPLEMPTGPVVRLWDVNRPFSISLDAPALLLARLPKYLTHGIFKDGIFSARLTVSKTLAHPEMNGEMQLINGRLRKQPGAMTGLAGRLVAHGSQAALEFATIDFADGTLPLHGVIDFTNPMKIAVQLVPEARLFALQGSAGVHCISGLNLFQVKAGSARHQNLFPEILDAGLQGAWNGDDWKIALRESASTIWRYGAADQSETFPLCRDGTMLQLGVGPGAANEATLIFEGRRLPSP
jgi:hypothetical protein